MRKYSVVMVIEGNCYCIIFWEGQRGYPESAGVAVSVFDQFLFSSMLWFWTHREDTDTVRMMVWENGK